MALGATVSGTITVQAGLPDLVLDLEDAFGINTGQQDFQTLRMLVAMQETSQNFIESARQSDDRTVKITWFSTCDDDANDCEEDLCDAPEGGTMPNLNSNEVTIDECFEYKFYVDDSILQKSIINRSDLVNRQLRNGQRALLRSANEFVATAVDANLYDTENFATPTTPTEYAYMLSNLLTQSQVDGLPNPFMINDGSLRGFENLAYLGRDDIKMPFYANGIFPTAYDPIIDKSGYIISPNAYAVAGLNYNPSAITSWTKGRGGKGIERFSLPTGIPGLITDVYVSYICVDADRDLHMYEYVMKLRMDAFFNPNPCYFTGNEEDAITGILAYTIGADEGGGAGG